MAGKFTAKEDSGIRLIEGGVQIPLSLAMRLATVGALIIKKGVMTNSLENQLRDPAVQEFNNQFGES